MNVKLSLVFQDPNSKDNAEKKNEKNVYKNVLEQDKRNFFQHE